MKDGINEINAIRSEIASLTDRLQVLQEGLTTRSRQKSLAITKLEEAIHWLEAEEPKKRNRRAR